MKINWECENEKWMKCIKRIKVKAAGDTNYRRSRSERLMRKKQAISTFNRPFLL